MSKSFTPVAISSIVIGLLVILENFNYIRLMALLWPIFPFIIGFGMIYSFNERGKQDFILLGIGTYITGLSLFFFWLNFVGWHKLAILWPIFIGLLGIAFIPVIYFGERRKIHYLISAFLIALSVLFFLVFQTDPRLWPLSLVMFGITILLISR